MERIIFHIDVNSAFLSWEAVYRLQNSDDGIDLREIPSAVGGDRSKRHGVVLAKSVPAKAFHITTGEPLTDALKKCPSLLIVPPNHELYSEYSKAFINILREYTPDVEQYSIDEAFMDMSGTEKLWGDPVTTAHTIQNRIADELGFTVNIGISSNKLLAKMASDFQKPNRIHTLFPNEIKEKMWPLPISDLFLAGRASCLKLNTLGIHTIGDLAHANPTILKQHLKSHGEVLWNYANGRDCSPVEHTSPANKGYGNSTTVSSDICDEASARPVLLSLAETVAMRIRHNHVKITVISVTIKTYDFQTFSHQRILEHPTDVTNEIYQTACELFSELWDYKTPLRLLGISTSRVNEDNSCRQISLTELISKQAPDYEKLSKADRMADAIRNRFGMNSLKRGTLTDLKSNDKV